jgi:hypothetical protein
MVLAGVKVIQQIHAVEGLHVVSSWVQMDVNCVSVWERGREKGKEGGREGEKEGGRECTNVCVHVTSCTLLFLFANLRSHICCCC